MGGYVGKIIRVDLTTRNISFIDTAKYEKWGGGHGIGSALFYDIAVKEKGLDFENMDHNSPDDGGFHPDNVVTIMTSPLSATGVPAATGRTEVQGIGVQQYPIGWFTRSNFGGYFGPMLKFAGYDGIVIEGASPNAVWIDIRDENITIRDCDEIGLWGKDTTETQYMIWAYVAGQETYGSWISPNDTNGSTTQRPAVLTIGRAGEKKSRMACLIHSAACAAGQGGFGGVWGSKNLKAISVIGTGSVPVDDPAGLLSARLSNVRDYALDVDKADLMSLSRGMIRHNMPPTIMDAYGKTPTYFYNGDLTDSLRKEKKGPLSCMGCYAACRGRYKSGKANGASCAGTWFYGQADEREFQIEATDLINRYGFNTYDFFQGLPYLNDLAEKGVIGLSGSGAEIESDLDFSTFGSLEFAGELLRIVAERDTPFGDTVADGFMRAVVKWGRVDDLGDNTEEDKSHLRFPYWGMPEHHYDGRAEVEWGYGTILGDRDINEHAFAQIYLDNYWGERIPFRGTDATAEEAVRIYSSKMLPQANEYDSPEDAMQMLNYSTENIYSIHIVRLVAWHRHFTRFFKESMLFCDMKWPDFVNRSREDKAGSSPWVEPQFIKTVTGKNLSFLEGMEIGRKIWNLDNAIWVLQGRHRDMVRFSEYMYKSPFPETYKMPTYNPDKIKKWAYRDCGHRCFDSDKFENFKTKFYTYEGWDIDTGWPTRQTLEELDMGDVADSLAYWGKLGTD
ncbi:MAG: hypothetical protein KJ737_22755 [Proteobacteria bacterium]|nr:hypothetical protein [Pseudomonadota bacterium]